MVDSPDLQEESKMLLIEKNSLTSQLANQSEVQNKNALLDYVFPEEYFKAMTVGEWVKVIS